MAGIKSVKTSSGKRVQVGSKAYSREMSSGATAVSGTGKNLTSKDIKGIGGGFTSDTLAQKTKGVPQGMTDPAAVADPTAPTQAQVNAPNAPTPPTGTANFGDKGQYNYNVDSKGVPYGAPNQAGQQYKTALATTQASGVPDAKTMGEATGLMNSTIQTPQNAVSPLGGIMETDTNFDSIFTNLDKYMEPLQQKKSLLQEYQGLSKELGINDLNEELIDAKRIIEGTEDDIRSEVQAVSGFATDSQVLALSNARNKSLVKNYNVLLESRDNAMQQLDTMMNLTIEDRKAAEAEFDRKMNFTFKIAEFKERAVANAREGYNNTIKLMGADGMYNALLSTGDPQAMALAERTLGVPQGGLAIAAQQATKQRALDSELNSLDVELKKSNLLTDKAQRANIYSEINERKNPNISGAVTLNGKPQTQAEATAQGYADRLVQANNVISTLGSQFTGKFAQLPTFNAFKSPERQQYEQAKKNFTTGVLRRESGAAIGKDEYETADKQYFPQRGDSDEVIIQKEIARATAMNNFYREANVPNPLTSDNTPDGNVWQ